MPARRKGRPLILRLTPSGFIKRARSNSRIWLEMSSSAVNLSPSPRAGEKTADVLPDQDIYSFDTAARVSCRFPLALQMMRDLTPLILPIFRKLVRCQKRSHEGHYEFRAR